MRQHENQSDAPRLRRHILGAVNVQEAARATIDFGIVCDALFEKHEAHIREQVKAAEGVREVMRILYLCVPDGPQVGLLDSTTTLSPQSGHIKRIHRPAYITFYDSNEPKQAEDIGPDFFGRPICRYVPDPVSGVLKRNDYDNYLPDEMSVFDESVFTDLKLEAENEPDEQPYSSLILGIIPDINFAVSPLEIMGLQRLLADAEPVERVS